MTASRWHISDELSEKITPIITERKTNHPLGTRH